MASGTLALLLVSICVSLVSAQQSSPDECTHRNRTYGVGYTWQVAGKCMTYSCRPGGLITAVGCAPVLVTEDSSCYLEDGDSKQLYPHCCDQVVCPPEEELETTTEDGDDEFSTTPLAEAGNDVTTEPNNQS